MKVNLRAFATAVAAIVLVGCGGNRSASINFPYLRLFNAVDGQTQVQLQVHDLSSNLLSTSSAVLLGAANPLPDMNFVYSQGTETLLDHNGVPLYQAASITFAQNTKYTTVASGSTAKSNFALLTLTDDITPIATTAFNFRPVDAAVLLTSAVDVYVLPAGQTTPGAGDSPAVANLTYSTRPTAANGAGIDADGYLSIKTNGATTFSVVWCLAGSKTPIFPAQSISITGGDSYTAVIWDTGNAQAQNATLLTDNR